jgi:hypothetical protein
VSRKKWKITTVDTKELGEAMDMIKDLSEAIYYNTIVKSMEGPKEDEAWIVPSVHVRQSYMEHKKSGHDKAVQM